MERERRTGRQPAPVGESNAGTTRQRCRSPAPGATATPRADSATTRGPDRGHTRAMLDLLTDVLATAPARCSYAEARHVSTDEEDLLVRNGRVDHIDSSA